MNEMTIQVPRYLIFERTIEFVSSFKHLSNQNKYVFDFENLKRIDPFSLLYLSSELRTFKLKNSESEFLAKNFQHCTYAAHMGFFQSFGLDFGKQPGEANNNNRYIPIRIYDVPQIKESARDLMVHTGEILEGFAKEISEVLTQNYDKDLTEILRYCLREALRNIVEHSHSQRFGFCAQYLPSLNVVSFAVLDRGIGIKESLKDNPKLKLETHLEAIKESLKPGISGKIYPGQKRKPKGDWANSGYGLFMTSNICKNGGSFFVASGDKGIYLSSNDEKTLDINIDGTSLNLTINLNQKNNLNDLLQGLREEAGKLTSIKASKSSMNK
jgi:anti-sigma regulatory factor (Ser/Thr protein kinase)